jgi:hypothetical protein
MMSDVTGQNNASVDVPAVQQAVDAGGTVVLHGTFNFTNARLPGPVGTRVILVTNAVTIRGEDATIVGGGSAAPGGQQAVFLVDASGHDVTIEALRLVNAFNAAIRVVRSGNLRIAKCQVNGVIPSAVTTQSGTQNVALGIHFPGNPVGAVSILENRIQIGGARGDTVGGIIMTGPANSLLILDNRIAQTTSHGVDLRDITGPAQIERNTIETGNVGRSGLPGFFVDALRLIGSGKYVVEHNQFDCGFENAAVVRLGGTTKAVVRANEIVASVPMDRAPGFQSAGVQVEGSAIENEILENRIKGRGRAAISVIFSSFPLDKGTGTGNPVGTTFRGNNVQQFAPTTATVEIVGAQNTTIDGGNGTLIDSGTGTVVHGNFHQPA